MTRTGQRRLASLRVRIAHMCFMACFRGINVAPWQSWGPTGEVFMSVDRVEEVDEAESADAAAAVTTAALTYYPIAPGVRLNVRSGPGTSYPVVKVLNEGT